MTDIVECHSGSVFAERPMALTWQGQRYIIVEILSQGRTPQAKWFRVKTEEGLLFELSYLEAIDDCPSEHVWKIHQY